MINLLKFSRHHLWAILGVAIVVAGLLYLKNLIPPQVIQSWIEQQGPAAPILYMGLSILVYMFAPFFAQPLIYAGYYVFGRQVVLYVTFVSFCNFFTNFWIARILGKEILERLVGKKVMRKIDQISSEYGYTALFFLRVFQGGMNDLISYTAGLTGLKFLPYLIISTIGLFPGMALWFAVATLYPDPVDFFFMSTIMSVVLAGVFIAGSIFFKFVKGEHPRQLKKKQLLV